MAAVVQLSTFRLRREAERALMPELVALFGADAKIAFEELWERHQPAGEAEPEPTECER